MAGSLIQATSVFAHNGMLQTSIHLTPTTHVIQPNAWVGNGALELITRSLNGTLPGPVLYLNPGDTLVIDFYNDLEADPAKDESYRHNNFSAPNESNLHFHGLHVSGELPSDDVTLVVKPGDHFQYITELPEDHLPGTHWLHPHRHGSTALQVGGGAAGVMIVQDTTEMKDQLPTQITEAPEMILVIQEIDLEEISEIAAMSFDSLLTANWQGDSAPLFDINEERFYVTNGQVNPSAAMPPNEWIRFRIVNAAWAHGERVNLELPGCEMQLIAKDGVYLPTLPRRILKAEIVNAGRADIMIKCPFDDKEEYQMMSSYDPEAIQPVLTLTRSSESTGNTATDIPRTTIDFPGYLQDLRDAVVTPGCSCVTEIDDLEYPEEESYFHETFQGAIVERIIDPPRDEPLEHPYHQHVHPFQIVEGANATDPDSTAYYQVGDWHDTLDGANTIRYQPTVFTGKLMIHCHNLVHEDEGMMATEYIHPKEEGQNVCSCGEVAPWDGNGGSGSDSGDSSDEGRTPGDSVEDEGSLDGFNIEEEETSLASHSTVVTMAPPLLLVLAIAALAF